MSDKYAIVSSREELDSLIKDLFGQTNIHHSREKKADRNELTEPLNHDQIDTSDFSEFLDFCYYRSFKLLADSIHNNTSLSTEQRNAALTLSRDLMLFFPIMEHLIVSSLYTVRYLLNDSYMRLDEYVYFNLSLKKGQSFLNNDFLNKYTDIAAAQILENSESSKDKSTKETSCNTIVIHKVKKTTKNIRIRLTHFKLKVYKMIERTKFLPKTSIQLSLIKTLDYGILQFINHSISQGHIKFKIICV